MSTPVELDPKEYVEALTILKNIDFFQDVSDERMKSVLFMLQKQTFAPNKIILFQGEIANRLFIIRQGSVSISTKNKGAKIHLADLQAPSYFGEISLLTPTSATATVTAGEAGAQVLILTHDAMTTLTNTLPDIQKRIQTVIDNRLASKKQAKDIQES